MNKKLYLSLSLAAAAILLPSCKTATQEAANLLASEMVINDSNTPLHLMQPLYSTPYGIPTESDVKANMDRVLHYLEKVTPAKIMDLATGQEVSDLDMLPDSAHLYQGDFRLTSYEWGVTYAAMVTAAEVTGDKAYENYMRDRIKLIAHVAPHFRKTLADNPLLDTQMRRVVMPTALDDAGAMCVAIIRLKMNQDIGEDFSTLIENYIDYIMNKEYRLADGTFARNRPHHNTVWLDDMYMGVPALAWYGRYSGNSRYTDEAVRQIRGFKSRMWVPEKKLFRHGWVESMDVHPAFHWGRANGWAILTLCEVLDAIPENHAARPEILDLLRQHVAGLTALQSGEGFWHQLLDRNDSYLETSATAIYTYCIAHAINRGWIDAEAYGPVAMLGWNAVSTQINEHGQIEGTCVGTGMGFDPAFYCYRPVHVMAAHGYGPAIWAGAEIIRLLQNQHPKMNDSAVQFYRSEQKTDEPIFSEGVSGGEIF